jgi:hypothetical protein
MLEVFKAHIDISFSSFPFKLFGSLLLASIVNLSLQAATKVQNWPAIVFDKCSHISYLIHGKEDGFNTGSTRS